MEIFGDLIEWYDPFWINNLSIHFIFWLPKLPILIDDPFILCVTPTTKLLLEVVKAVHSFPCSKWAVARRFTNESNFETTFWTQMRCRTLMTNDHTISNTKKKKKKKICQLPRFLLEGSANCVLR
jgi:hypothetical protein